MTIEEMLEVVGFDEQFFKNRYSLESLDPAGFRAVYFDFNASLPSANSMEESFKEWDGSETIFRYKQLFITKELSLFLYESAQATLEFDGIEIITFYWNDDIEKMFNDIDNVKISELFNKMIETKW